MTSNSQGWTKADVINLGMLAIAAITVVFTAFSFFSSFNDSASDDGISASENCKNISIGGAEGELNVNCGVEIAPQNSEGIYDH
ncbi:MAG: hypothetical protein AAFR25_06425 [Cyanobacteria bacterium J06629_19]